MDHLRYKVVSFISLALVVAIAFLLQTQETKQKLFHPETLDNVLNEYRLKGHLGEVSEGYKSALESYLTSCVDLLKNRFQKEFKGYRINESFSENYINIYFVEEDPDKILTSYKGNCAYTGHRNVILCDLAFVQELQTRRSPFQEEEVFRLDSTGVFTQEMNPFMVNMLKKLSEAQLKNTLLWILGHEIGHIAYDHGNLHFTFEEEEVDSLYNPLSKYGIPEEIEADDFAVEAAGQASFFLFIGLVSFINELGNELLSSQGHSLPLVSSKENIIVYAQSKTHAPLFVRAVDLMIALLKRYKYESPEYYENLRERIVIKQGVVFQ